MPLLTIFGFLRGLTLKHILIAVAAAGLAFSVWQGVGFVQDKIAADAAVLRLERVIEVQEQSIALLKREAAQRAAAEAAADAAREKLAALQKDYDEIRRANAASPEEDDAEIAPVLRRTLDALDRLHARDVD